MKKENITRTKKRSTLVRYNGLPAAKPLSAKVKRMSDAQIERAAVVDPDVGIIPPGFWENAQIVDPARKQQITLRIDRDILAWFRDHGKGYQGRINAVLKSYVSQQRSH